MKKFNAIRQLARSHRWQLLYARSKETSGIKLFNNEADFTPLQVLFLQWLEIYNSIHHDIAMDECTLKSDELDNDIRVDAYLYCKSIKDKNKTEKKQPRKGFEAPSHIPTVIFQRG